MFSERTPGIVLYVCVWWAIGLYHSGSPLSDVSQSSPALLVRIAFIACHGLQQQDCLHHHMATRTLTIDDLPNEILLLIFIRGCEELFDNLYEFRPRSLKSFASLTRSISRRWKELIDTNSNNKWSFWIARLYLDVGSSPEGSPWDPWNPLPFAKRLARFRHQLRISQGCDLEVIFALPRSDAWITSFESLSQISSIILKLFLYAMEYISPYRNQISLLRMLGNQLHVYLHLLRIIAVDTWAKAPRLTELSFEQTNLPMDRPKTIPELTSLTDVLTPFRRVLQPENSRSLGSADFSHLHSLETLVVPVSSWLHPEFQVPTSLKDLRIAVADTESIPTLSNYFIDPRQRPLCENLRSIVIGTSNSWRWGITAEEAERVVRWTSPSRISLPLLRSITMDGVATEHARRFLACSTFPSLEIVSLDTIGRVHVGPSILSLEQSGTVSEVPLSNAREHDFQAPRLKQLTISTPFLACLSVFVDCSLEKLAIGYDEWNAPDERPSPWSNESEAVFADRFSKFHPRCLGLNSVSYRNALLIIRSLGTQNLQTLTMVPWVHSMDSNSHGVSALLRPDQRIYLPSLESLIWSGREDQIAYFLSNLDAARLEQLSITLHHHYPDFGDWDRESALRSSSLPAVKRVRYTLQITTPFPDHWKLLPNAEELFITVTQPEIPPRSSIPDDTTEFKDLEEALSTIISHLCTNIESKRRDIPFPQLRVLSISYQRSGRSTYPGLPHSRMIIEDQIRVTIGGILEAHQSLETPRFILDGPVRLSYENGRESWWDAMYREKIEIKFVARAQMDEARDQTKRNVEL
jgi:hypothetical protein